jgi:hypothetical protein
MQDARSAWEESDRNWEPPNSLPAYRSAIARPIPRLEPVMNSVFPFKEGEAMRLIQAWGSLVCGVRLWGPWVRSFGSLGNPGYSPTNGEWRMDVKERGARGGMEEGARGVREMGQRKVLASACLLEATRAERRAGGPRKAIAPNASPMPPPRPHLTYFHDSSMFLLQIAPSARLLDVSGKPSG